MGKSIGELYYAMKEASWKAEYYSPTEPELALKFFKESYKLSGDIAELELAGE